VVHVAGVEAVELVKPEPFARRSNGPAALASQVGVLCFLPIQAVMWPFCRSTSAMVPVLRGRIVV
jgi:hypothetical protein